VEDLVDFLRVTYAGKRVLVTGHNGFKGSWLVSFLNWLGADVSGISLEIARESPFKEFHSQGMHHSHIIDIRDFEKLKHQINHINPEIVFHLAAQPLVLESYKNPRETFETNVQGTVNLLEVVTNMDCLGIVVATTDKVYKNDDSGTAFCETDTLWGHDPYSFSKTGAELAVSAWRNLPKSVGCSLVTVRAGNVYGAGDRSADRLFPDLLRSIKAETPVQIRNPDSVRPWQYVLDPLLGYLLVGAKILIKAPVGLAYNFGPNVESILPVSEFVNTLSKITEINYEILGQMEGLESKILKLDSSKALNELHWQSITSLEDGLKQTLELEDSELGVDACYSHIEKYLLNTQNSAVK
jgi:CDP-glucose 4,6-dehydratase